MNKTATPELVAHRGDMHNRPENSWRAIESALQAGACWLEFDIQMCADGTFILLHDDNLLRTADIEKSVFTATYADIENISIHYAALFGERFLPTPIHTLEKVLQMLAAHSEVRAMIEIKEESMQNFGLEVVMDSLLSIVTRWQHRHVLISFDQTAIDYAHHHSSMQTGWVVKKYDNAHLKMAQLLKPDYLICNHRKLPAGEKPWPGEWQWMLYDICDPAIAMKWGGMGVELIETGDITQMLKHPSFAQSSCRHGL